jgi:ATP-binding cassette subfamily C protein LapB
VNPKWNFDGWVEAFEIVAQRYGLPVLSERARLSDQWRHDSDPEDRLAAVARDLGLEVQTCLPRADLVTEWRLPLIAELRSGELAVITAIGADGQANVTLVGERGMAQTIETDQLPLLADRFVIARPSATLADARVDSYIRPYEEHWLRRILLRDVRSYSSILVASLVTNLLALAGILFSMQVYDRVVPAESMPTLYVLFFGVLLAIGFGFVLTRLRGEIIDVLGRRADMRISDRVFGHALRVRSDARPAATGTFIAQLRDLEQVREVLTSTTVAAVADMPFFVVFVGIFWLIAGPLALVPLAALVLLIIPGVLAQRKLRAFASEAMRESSLRNAMLVEAVQRSEDIKTLQAEDRFQQQWNHLNAVAGEAQLKLRRLTGGLTAWTQSVQTAVYATIVFVGAPLVIAGDITTGTLVAASILGSRMMAPVAQASQVLNRLQQAKVGIAGADQIMALPVDDPVDAHRIRAPRLEGAYRLKAATFAYGEGGGPPELTVADLTIAAGEKVGLLGRNGAGKSTLLQGLSGLLQPKSGEVLIDDMALAHIDTADVRRGVALLSQSSRLFHGTLHENLTLGAPDATDQQIFDALEMVGADEFVRRAQAGLGYAIQEGGSGMSGGQTQALLLARLLLRDPAVVLLDEPTAAMDEAAERHFIERFSVWANRRTLVIATHRMRVLDLVDRLIVIQAGGIALDQPKLMALQTMQPEPKKGKAA